MNYVMLMEWMRVSSFCIVWVWFSTKLWPNIIRVNKMPRWIFFI